MSIVSRYVFRQAAGALLLILLSLSGVVWIALALKQLKVVTSQGQDAWTLLAMTTLALPNLMALIAPVALLIAAIHTLNRLNGDSELIVLTASGATVWVVGRPLILLAVLVSIGVGVVNHIVMPWSLRLLRDYVIEVRTDLLTQVIQPGRFSKPEPYLTFHIRDRTFAGELLGVLMHDRRDPNLPLTYVAERAIITKQDDTAYLTLTNGHILREAGNRRNVQIIAFQRYALDLAGFEQKGDVVELKPRERYFGELIAPDPNDPVFQRIPGQFRAELHERLSNPLYPIAFVLIALGFVGQAQSTRQNRAQIVAAGFIIAAGARVSGLALNNLVVLRPEAIPLMYQMPILAMGLGIAAMSIGARPLARPRWLEAVADKLDGLVQRLPRLPMPPWPRRAEQ